MDFELYMNGLPAKIKRYLRQSSPRDLIQKYIITSGRTQWPMDIGALSVVERGLFNQCENNNKDYALARFTSGLIYRICVDCVFPRRNIQLDIMLPPILLLETAFRHMSPSQLGIKMSWNLRGPSEHIFQIELYSVFRDLLPRHWRCAGEVHEVESMKKEGDNRWRLDLMLLAESTDSEDSGSPGPNDVGFELKVDKISKSEISEAVDQAFSLGTPKPSKSTFTL
jgi:hypothetical protein